MSAGKWIFHFSWLGRAAQGALLLGFLGCLLAAACGQALVRAISSPRTVALLARDSALSERYQSGLARFVTGYALFRFRAGWPEGKSSLSLWSSLAGQVLPPGWAEDEFFSLGNAAQEWLAAPERLLPDVSLDLQPVKAHLTGPQGTLAALTLLQTLPTCPPESADFQYGENGLPLCAAQGRDQTAGAERLAAMLAKSLPEQVSLEQAYQEGYLPPGVVETLQHLRGGFWFAGEAASAALRLALLLLSLFLLTGARSLDEFIPSGLAAFFSAAGLLALESSRLVPAGLIGRSVQSFLPLNLPAWQLDLLTAALRSGPLEQLALAWAGRAALAGFALLAVYGFRAAYRRMRPAQVGAATRPLRTIKQSFRS